ncbi:MAG: hypothetical protein KAY32_02480 [Candidatus Eisenbacteria sp.]|nr:hypothetical protein [Candidatus Eisenbacteria bacterium]
MRTTLMILGGALLVASIIPAISLGEDAPGDRVTYDNKTYPLFPGRLAEEPRVPSPLITEDGREIVTCFTLDGRYFLVPVTVENGEPLNYSSNQWLGKGRQLEADSLDFPALGRTGLHSEAELEQTETITGVPVAEITRIGRPGAYSIAGFMSQDEDIVSVLQGDDGLVRRLGLTHPQCAKPLFHVFNVILSVGKDSEPGNVGGILYDGRNVHLKFSGHKGWQESIFNDEILGYWEIEIRRELDQEEEAFLSSRYPHHAADKMAELTGKLGFIHIGEMVPYYIMRYGFYEGHTSYRADPLAIACIFGLKSIQEIESAFEGRLYQILTNHFRDESSGE